MESPESCRKPDKVGKLRDDHPCHQHRCHKPDTDENRRKVQKITTTLFNLPKKERLKWCNPEDIDPATGDIKGMDLHIKAKSRGFANPMEMYHADQQKIQDTTNATITSLEQQIKQLTALVQTLVPNNTPTQ